MIRFYLLLLYLLTSQQLYLYAQIDYTVSKYTSENGLPQNSVKSIASDAEGFVWVATEDGLVRFDGQNFKVFNTNNLPININRVAGIRLSTTNQNAAYRERAHIAYASFERFSGRYAAKIQDGKVTVDTLFSSVRDRKIIASDIGTKTMDDVTLIAHIPDLVYNSQSGNDHHIIMAGGGEGNFFSVSKTQILYFKNWKKKYRCLSPGAPAWDYFTIGEHLYYRKDKSNYVRIFDGVLSPFKLDIPDNRNSDFRIENEKLYWNGNSQQAFISVKDKVYILDQKNGGNLSARLLIENFDAVKNGIDVIYFDSASEKVFMGSRVNGLYILAKKQFKTLETPGIPDDNVFYSQMPVSSHSILTPTGIIVGMQPGSHKIINRRVNLNPSDKRVMLKSKDGSIWFKSYKSLFKLNQDKLSGTKLFTFQNDIKALIEGDNHDIWIGVIKEGLYRYTYPGSGKSPQLIPNDSLKEITYLANRGKYELLIGTSNGLYVYHTNTHLFHKVKHTDRLNIKSIRADENKKVWFTAQGVGLMLWEGGEHVVTFPLDRKLYLASPHCVMDDGTGYLWIPTNRGLFQVSKSDLLTYASFQNKQTTRPKSRELTQKYPNEIYYSYHTMEEGFLTNEFNGGCQPCAVKLENGYISLPSLNGLVWFQPEQIQNYMPDGRIILDKVTIDGIELSSLDGTLRFPVEADDIALSFSTAYFGNRENIKISYAIVPEGEKVTSSDWIQLNNDELDIHMSGNRSGRYALYVGKSGGFTKPFTTTKLDLDFPQKWYKNGWILFSLSLLALIAVAFLTDTVNRYKLKIMVAKNARLEGVIAVRTEKLNTTLEGLKTSERDKNEQIHLLSRLITSISHDVQSPLKYMSFALKRIPDMVATNDTANILTAGALASDMSERISTMLGQLLEFSKVQIYGKQMKFETINIHKLIREKAEIFIGIIESNGSTFHNLIPEHKQVETDYRLLSIIVHNLLDNAAKYTIKGEIRVYLGKVTEHTKELVIANSGANIPDDVIEMINSPIKDRSLKELLDTGKVKGMGLLIVKEVAALAHISIAVSQTEYTSFHLSLPRPGTIPIESRSLEEQ